MPVSFLQESELSYEVETPGPPTVLELYCRDGGEEGDEVVYGTADGRLGLVQITRSVHKMTHMMSQWLLSGHLGLL